MCTLAFHVNIALLRSAYAAEMCSSEVVHRGHLAVIAKSARTRVQAPVVLSPCTRHLVPDTGCCISHTFALSEVPPGGLFLNKPHVMAARQLLLAALLACLSLGGWCAPPACGERDHLCVPWPDTAGSRACMMNPVAAMVAASKVAALGGPSANHSSCCPRRRRRCRRCCCCRSQGLCRRHTCPPSSSRACPLRCSLLLLLLGCAAAAPAAADGTLCPGGSGRGGAQEDAGRQLLGRCTCTDAEAVVGQAPPAGQQHLLQHRRHAGMQAWSGGAGRWCGGQHSAGAVSPLLHLA